MTTFFLSGHRDFGNRGCEAIVRSTVAIVRQAFPGAEFTVPSTDVKRDMALWPDSGAQGVSFHDCLQPPMPMRLYGKVRKQLGLLNNFYPPVAPPRAARRLIDASDAVLAVGGDNYSEDYALPYLPVLLDSYAMSAEKPTVLWGASIGPFAQSGAYRRFMSRHACRYSHVFIREQRSEDYCRQDLGVTRLARFADPAFALTPQPVPESVCDAKQCLGVNISPLVLSKLGVRADAFVGEVGKALKLLQKELGLDVLLVPHVMAYKGPNDDRIALRKLAGWLAAEGVKTRVVPHGLNAAQIKSIIGQCRLLIAARTHATIAAMSQGVPVVSIGYSVKAVGINEQVFGDARHVIDYRQLHASELVDRARCALAEQENEGSREEIRKKLKESAYESGVALIRALGRGLVESRVMTELDRCGR